MPNRAKKIALAQRSVSVITCCTPSGSNSAVKKVCGKASQLDIGQISRWAVCVSKAWNPLDKRFVVEDANGRPLAYVYFEDEPVRRGLMNRLTSDEAWRVAIQHRKIARLVEEKLASRVTARGT